MGRTIMGTCDFANCDEVGLMHSVQVIVDGTEWVTDLCDQHVEPILATVRGASKRKISDRNRVYSIDEIEAMKKDLKS